MTHRIVCFCFRFKTGAKLGLAAADADADASAAAAAGSAIGGSALTSSLVKPLFGLMAEQVHGVIRRRIWDSSRCVPPDCLPPD